MLIQCTTVLNGSNMNSNERGECRKHGYRGGVNAAYMTTEVGRTL